MTHNNKNCNCAECTLQRGGEACVECGEVGFCKCMEEEQRVKYVWLGNSVFSSIHMARGSRTFCGLDIKAYSKETDYWEERECQLCLKSVAYKEYRKEQDDHK